MSAQPTIHKSGAETPDWVWRAVKMPTYCKRHGQRIKGYVNGEPLCQKCVNLLWKAIEAGR